MHYLYAVFHLKIVQPLTSWKTFSIKTFHQLCIYLQPYGHLSSAVGGLGVVTLRNVLHTCVRERQHRRARLAAPWCCASPWHDILCLSQWDDLRKHSSHCLTSYRGGSFSLSLQGMQSCTLLHMSIPSFPPCRYSTLAQLGGCCCCSCPSVGCSHGLNTWVTEAAGLRGTVDLGFFYFCCQVHYHFFFWPMTLMSVTQQVHDRNLTLSQPNSFLRLSWRSD